MGLVSDGIGSFITGGVYEQGRGPLRLYGTWNAGY